MSHFVAHLCEEKEQGKTTEVNGRKLLKHTKELLALARRIERTERKKI